MSVKLERESQEREEAMQQIREQEVKLNEAKAKVCSQVSHLTFSSRVQNNVFCYMYFLAYCAFQQRTNSEVQNPTNIIIVFFTAVNHNNTI